MEEELFEKITFDLKQIQRNITTDVSYSDLDAHNDLVKLLTEIGNLVEKNDFEKLSKFYDLIRELVLFSPESRQKLKINSAIGSFLSDLEKD